MNEREPDHREQSYSPESAELAGEPLDGLPAAYWRILPLHAISETHGLAGLRHRLALEIADLQPDGETVCRQAWTLAERLHADDRRTREPYLHHVLRVTIRIMSHYRVRDPQVLAAALLHDAVEDHRQVLAGDVPADPTTAALAVIGRDFGDRVAGLVASVTNLVYDSSRDRDEQYRQHLIEALTGNPWARVIKLSDFTDNGVGLIHSTLAKVRRSATKYAPLVPALRELVRLPDTPLDDDVKAHILAQLDQAQRRFDAVLHG